MAEPTSGVLQFLRQGGGFLRDPKYSFKQSPRDAWLSSKMIKQFGLAEGAVITGTMEQSKRGFQLTEIEAVCGLEPEEFQARERFERLTAISPTERFRLGEGGNVTMRIIELLAPLGKGTRGLIVAPPKSGKTRILEELANAIHATEPDTRIIVLLIDERPEEVTHFRRNVNAEVLASSSDQTIESHVNLTEMTLGQIRCELECGRDIVVLVDSITRLSRAFNLHSTGVGRTMSGGLDATALEIPRRFFGQARNIENGGSVTVLATVLVETGSRMDGLIFEEFKGTGNNEIVLDRSLADARIFPAINLNASGTRREELLYSKADINVIAKLRRGLTELPAKEVMQKLLQLTNGSSSNEEMLKQLKKKF